MSPDTENGSRKNSGPVPEIKIYLTGFMGSGKTTVGPVLAGMMGCPFLDLDSRIEEEAGLTIPEIFRQYGETGFRRLESRVLRLVADGGPGVVALGGGAILDPQNLSLIRRTGVLIYLQVPTAELYRRLRDSEHRPLLESEKEGPERDNALYERIEVLMRAREPVYLEADYTVDSSDREPEELAEGILRLLGEKSG